MSISSKKKFPFGACTTIVETENFYVTVSTAKEGVFKGLSTMIYKGMYPFGEMCAKFLYPRSMAKSDRHRLHDTIASGLDEAANNVASLYEAVEAVAGFMGEHKYVEEVINICH